MWLHTEEMQLTVVQQTQHVRLAHAGHALAQWVIIVEQAKQQLIQWSFGVATCHTIDQALLFPLP